MSVVITLSLVCWVMANFMSNTATANLLMPIAAAIGATMNSLSDVGGLQGLLVVVAFSASLGMILRYRHRLTHSPTQPASFRAKTWPNRLIIGVIGLTIVYIAAAILG